jgi:hypothetical protein
MELFPVSSGSEYSGGLQAKATVEQAVDCCIDSALGLGFVLKQQDGLHLRFREPLRWISWPVEISVDITPHPKHTGISVFGSCFGGTPNQPLSHPETCVKTYLEVVGAELDNVGEAEKADPRRPARQRRLGTCQKWLGLASQLPQLLLVPMGIAAVLLWPRPGALILVSWCWFFALVPVAAEFLRRRLVGIDSESDRVALAVCVGVAIVFTLYYLFFINVL